MPNPMVFDPSLLIERLRAAVREYNQFLPTLNATEQEYAIISRERYIPISPEAEIDEETWLAAPLEDILEKLEDIEMRHDANERNVGTLDKLLGPRRRHPGQEESPSKKAEDVGQQAGVEEMQRLAVGKATKHDGH